MNLTLPILKGTQSAYSAIAVKDNSTLYITTDTKLIYLGDTLLSSNASGETIIRDVQFDTDTQTFTFEYTDDTTKDIDLVLESVIQDINYDEDTNILTLTVVSGATTDIDLSGLVKKPITENNIVIGSDDDIQDSGKKIVSSITDTTDNKDVPDVRSIKGILSIGTF